MRPVPGAWANIKQVKSVGKDTKTTKWGVDATGGKKYER